MREGAHSWTGNENEEDEEDEVVVASSAASSTSAVDEVEDEPPVTPWDAWPAALVSRLMLFVSFVCSSVILDWMDDVLLPAA